MKRRIAVLPLVLSGLILTQSSGAQTAPPAGSVVLEDRAGHRVTLSAGQSATVGQGGLGTLARVYVSPGLRATFCDSLQPGTRCPRLVGVVGGGSTPLTPLLTGSGTTVAVEAALFGYADLHAHPATHLAFGARGGQGPMWGRPGGSWIPGYPSVATDLPACASDTHSGFTADPLVYGARLGLTSLLERFNDDHNPSGWDDYSDWPAADSLIHQQMHVTMLHRAWEGGLRLMVASATDSQLLDVIWNPNNSVSQGRFALRADFEDKSARQQFDFIRQFVAANASWMAIATTPAEARQAIASNKLAIVLGLELDELSMDQILQLKADYGVALVGPVHLVNNSFGGSAVYEEFFNYANYLTNGRFFRVKADTRLGKRLPGIVNPSIPIVGPLINPYEAVAATNDYISAVPGGHRNEVGLFDDYGLRRLMKAGLLVDVAHMSWDATGATLTRASNGYPVVYSHGGLSEYTHGAESDSLPLEQRAERDLHPTHYDRLVASGGIFGLGTGGNGTDPTPVATWLHRYVDLASQGPVALGTDLNGMARQIDDIEPMPEVGDVPRFTYPITAIRDADWRPVPSGTLERFPLGSKRYDIRSHGIAHIGMVPDFLGAARRQALIDGTVAQFDQVFHSAHDFIATWERARAAAAGVDDDLPAAPVSELDLDVETGTDDLKCGGVMVSVFTADGRQVSPPMMINVGLEENTRYHMDLPIFPGTQLPDIRRVTLQYIQNQCDIFDTGDSWNIRTLKVSYSVMEGSTRRTGLLMHKRGTPARRLDRGDRWTVYTER